MHISMHAYQISQLTYINRNSTGTFCRERNFPEGIKMDKVFDWVNDEGARGERFKDPRTGMEVDRWVIHDVSLILSKAKRHMNILKLI